MGWDHDEDAVTDAWERQPDPETSDDAWAEDPSRCAEEGCMEEGTEPWEEDHYHGPLYYCKGHFAERAEREST